MFSNLALKEKLRKAVRFVCEIEKKGGALQPEKLAEDSMGTINENILSFLEGKHPSKTIPYCAKLETYKETPIFNPINITEGAVESVARKL